jgi:hypothetical protein
LQRDWVTSLSVGIKIPMLRPVSRGLPPRYTVLGTALCFSLTFSLVDILNQAATTCCFRNPDSRISRAFVQSPTQVYIVLTSSCLMGAIFGFSFGLLDVEDDNYRHFRFDKDQMISTIIGCTIGCVVGFLNQYVKANTDDTGMSHSVLDNHEDI